MPGLSIPAQFPTRNTGFVVVPRGHDVDLDAASGPWPVTISPVGNPFDLEYRFSTADIVAIDKANLGIPPSRTYDACASLQGYNGIVTQSQLKPGSYFCVITDQRRRAMVTVTAVTDDPNGQPESVTLFIQTWNHIIAPNA